MDVDAIAGSDRSVAHPNCREEAKRVCMMVYKHMCKGQSSDKEGVKLRESIVTFV